MLWWPKNECIITSMPKYMHKNSLLPAPQFLSDIVSCSPGQKRRWHGRKEATAPVEKKEDLYAHTLFNIWSSTKQMGNWVSFWLGLPETYFIEKSLQPCHTQTSFSKCDFSATLSQWIYEALNQTSNPEQLFRARNISMQKPSLHSALTASAQLSGEGDT